MSAMHELLSQLVAVDSVSSRGNLAVLDILEPRLAAAGFAVERQAVSPGKSNLLARRGPEGSGGLALVGHTDTVPYDPAWSEALVLSERDGRLYGRGACDTKGFIACAVAAASQSRPLSKPLWLVFTCDEEVGCLGAKALQRRSEFRPRMAIVGEPTELRPVRGGKGYCMAQVEVRGVEGHSAYPDRGASALWGAKLFLDELAKLEAQLRQESEPGIQGGFSPPYTTLNVGTLQAGKAKNIIPGEARLTVEWRPIPGQPLTRVSSALEAIGAFVKLRLPRLEIHIQVAREDSGFSTPAEAELVRFLEAASGNASATIPFGSEAHDLIALGTNEVVVFGPGDIRVAHQTGEFVPIDDLTRCEAILGQAIEKFCG
jgi:acetylornithine deacetylase